MCRCLFTPNPNAWDAMSDWVDVYEVYPAGVYYDNPASFSPVSQQDNIFPEIFGECCTCNDNSGCRNSCEMYCLYFYKNPSIKDIENINAPKGHINIQNILCDVLNSL